MTAICEMCRQPITAGHPSGPRTTRVPPYGLPGRLVFHAECGRVYSMFNREMPKVIRRLERGEPAFPPARPRPVPRSLRALGLTVPCSAGDVRRAYRRLALERHPDRGGTHEGFLALQRDYEQALRLTEGAAR